MREVKIPRVRTLRDKKKVLETEFIEGFLYKFSCKLSFTDSNVFLQSK